MNRVLKFLARVFFISWLVADVLSGAPSPCEEQLHSSRTTSFKIMTMQLLQDRNHRLARLIERERILRSQTAQRIALEILSGKSQPITSPSNWYIIEVFEKNENGINQLHIEIPVLRARLGMPSGSRPNNLNTFYVEFIAGIFQGAVSRISKNPDIDNVVINANFVTNHYLSKEFRQLGFKDNNVVSRILKFVFKGFPSRSMTLTLATAEPRKNH